MLRQRVITGLIAILLLAAATLLLPPLYFGLAATAAVLAAAWEWSGLLGDGGRGTNNHSPLEGESARQGRSPQPSRWGVSRSAVIRCGFMALVAGGCAAVLLLPDSNPRAIKSLLMGGCLFWLLCLGLLLALQGRAFNNDGDTPRPRVFTPFSVGVMGLLALLPALAALLHLQAVAGALALWVVLQVAAVDVGAYFIGRRYGRRRLAPSLSPNKTWAGVWGGFGLCGIVTATGAAWLWAAAPEAATAPAGVPALTGTAALDGYGVSSITPALLLASAPLVALGTVVGDLLESLLKRDAGLKDSGHWLPGHGGLLDRIDGLLAALPAAALLLIGGSLW